MPRATCRCGQALEMPPEGVDHITCPRCAAKVRIIRKARNGDAGASSSASGDGFLRIPLPLRSTPEGQRDRSAGDTASAPTATGSCPVPANATSAATSGSNNESPTEELATADVAMLEAWSRRHLGRSNGPMSTVDMPYNDPARKGEAGFRTCPRCGKPIHLNADTCRACGTPCPGDSLGPGHGVGGTGASFRLPSGAGLRVD